LKVILLLIVIESQNELKDKGPLDEQDKTSNQKQPAEEFKSDKQVKRTKKKKKTKKNQVNIDEITIKTKKNKEIDIKKIIPSNYQNSLKKKPENSDKPKSEGKDLKSNNNNQNTLFEKKQNVINSIDNKKGELQTIIDCVKVGNQNLQNNQPITQNNRKTKEENERSYMEQEEISRKEFLQFLCKFDIEEKEFRQLTKQNSTKKIILRDENRKMQIEEISKINETKIKYKRNNEKQLSVPAENVVKKEVEKKISNLNTNFSLKSPTWNKFKSNQNLNGNRYINTDNVINNSNSALRESPAGISKLRSNFCSQHRDNYIYTVS